MKIFCISLSKLRGRLFTIFTAYIVSVFLACFYNGCACDRFSAWSCPLKRAVYNTPDSQYLECYTVEIGTTSGPGTVHGIKVSNLTHAAYRDVSRTPWSG